MRSPFGIRQPQYGPLARLETRHGASEIGALLRRAAITAGSHAFDIAARQAERGANQAAAPCIPRQVRCNAIERIAAMRFTLMRRGSTQKAIERFLKQVVRLLTIGGDQQGWPYRLRPAERTHRQNPQSQYPTD